MAGTAAWPSDTRLTPGTFSSAWSRLAGVRAAMSNKPLGLIDNWLRHIRDVHLWNREELAAIKDPKARVDRLAELLLFLLPRYRQENRSYLTVAIGCTGGRHRSVAVVEQLASRLAAAGWPARRVHRELDRERR